MGLRPLRMKVRWGCPPRVLSPPPHRTQSWRPCLPGQPWASGWRSTDRPVPSPHGWTIGFSERGAAHNRVLPRCLSSRRCMRSWRVRGWPLSAALCLPRRAAEREGCLQTEVGPLDSGGRRLGVPVARRAMPPGGEGSLHQECCLLPCVGARCLFGRHLQSCGLGDTEHLRKILQSSRWASFFPCIG